jgi:hypothetical protein
VPCSASRVVPGAHRVVGPGTHRGSGPREVHTTPPGQPLPQRNRPESLTIKRNRRNHLSRVRTRGTRKTTKSSPVQGDSWGKVTNQRGTRSSYVTPSKNLTRNRPQNSATKITTKSSENHQKGGQERQHKNLRNHNESSVHTMKVHTRSTCHPIIHPSL